MKKYLLLTVVFICAQTIELSAQLHQESPFDSCEIISGKLDVVGNSFRRMKPTETKLIVIAGSPGRSGDSYDKIRIENASAFLSKFYQISKDDIVVAFGRPENASYLQFYIEGKPAVRITVGPKSRLCNGLGEPLISRPN